MQHPLPSSAGSLTLHAYTYTRVAAHSARPSIFSRLHRSRDNGERRAKEAKKQRVQSERRESEESEPFLEQPLAIKCRLVKDSSIRHPHPSSPSLFATYSTKCNQMRPLLVLEVRWFGRSHPPAPSSREHIQKRWRLQTHCNTVYTVHCTYTARTTYSRAHNKQKRHISATSFIYTVHCTSRYELADCVRFEWMNAKLALRPSLNELETALSNEKFN